MRIHGGEGRPLGSYHRNLGRRRARLFRDALRASVAVSLVGFGSTGLARAAGIGVRSNGFGAGSSIVSACQAGALSVRFVPIYDSSIDGYGVGSVRIEGLDTTSRISCASRSFELTLSGTSNSSLAEVTGTTPSSGSGFSVDLSGEHLAVRSVEGFHPVIDG
jgi:hypothetical protein